MTKNGGVARGRCPAREARIAIKKLRYAAEIAVRIGYAVSEPLVRDLKKTADASVRVVVPIVAKAV